MFYKCKNFQPHSNFFFFVDFSQDNLSVVIISVVKHKYDFYQIN